MYITLNKYKSSLLETKEQLSKGVELDNLYKDIYDVYGYAKKWLYSAENQHKI